MPLLLDVTDEEGVQRAVEEVDAELAKRGVKLVGGCFWETRTVAGLLELGLQYLD